MSCVSRAGGTQLLPRVVGRTRAKELIFTGRRVNADEAAHMGGGTTVELCPVFAPTLYDWMHLAALLHNPHN